MFAGRLYFWRRIAVEICRRVRPPVLGDRESAGPRDGVVFVVCCIRDTGNIDHVEREREEEERIAGLECGESRSRADRTVQRIASLVVAGRDILWVWL